VDVYKNKWRRDEIEKKKRRREREGEKE